MNYKYKIVTDSSCDLKQDYLVHDYIGFEVVPLTLHIKDKEIIDNDNFSQDELLNALGAYSGKSSSSCPSPGTYQNAFKDSEYVFCVTISSKLSGSYNSAVVASENCVNQKIFIIDSKLVSGAQILIIDELVRLIEAGLTYQAIVEEITKFRNSKDLLFVIDRYDNLIKNGRVSKLQALIAGILKIKLLSCGNEGEIKILEKIRTKTQALKRMVEIIGERISNFAERHLVISYCKNLEDAELVKKSIEDKYKFRSVRLFPMKGLTTFYALNGGLIISY